MAAPCGCAAEYEALVANLEALSVNAHALNPGLARANVDHICEAAGDVERSCGVNMQRVADLVQPLSDEVEGMFRTLLDAATLEEPSFAAIALSGGEVEEIPPVKRGIPVTGAIFRNSKDVERAGQDALRGAEDAFRGCTTPECECAKAAVTFGAVADGVRRAAERTDIEDLAAAGTALRGVAEGVARACGIPPPPGAALDEVAKHLDEARRKAPVARELQERLRRTAKAIAEAPSPGPEVEILPSGRREVRGIPGRPPTRREEAQAMLEQVERELRQQSPEEREARIQLWLEVRDMAARQGASKPCPLPAGFGDVLESAAKGASVGATIGSIVPGVGTLAGGAIGGVAGAAGEVIGGLLGGGGKKVTHGAFVLAPLAKIVVGEVGKALAGKAKEEVGKAVGKSFRQEEPPAGFEEYAKVAGIPTFTEGERAVLDVRTDPEFLDRMVGEGFTIEQLASITVQQHRDLWWALGHGRVTKDTLRAMAPDEARAFASANPEPPTTREQRERARERFREWLAAQGLEQVKEIRPGPVVARPSVRERVLQQTDPRVAEVIRGQPETRIRFRRIPKPANPCPEETDAFRAADEALLGHRAPPLPSGEPGEWIPGEIGRLDVASLVRAVVDCERAAVEQGEPVALACKEPRDRLAAAHERLFPFEHRRQRVERDLMKCLGPKQAREAGLPHGRVLEEAPFAATLPPAEVRAYEEARDRLIEAVDDVSGYVQAARSTCRELEERPSLMRVIGLA